jgi:hypothetical protein
MNYKLVVIIMPACNKNLPEVYDVIDSKDKQKTVDKLKAVLRYSCMCDAEDDDTEAEAEDGDTKDADNASEDEDEDPEYSCSFFHDLMIEYEEYSISMDTYTDLIPRPNCCPGGYVIFVKKENYAINEILNDIHIY